jgi:hypothetical protein
VPPKEGESAEAIARGFGAGPVGGPWLSGALPARRIAGMSRCCCKARGDRRRLTTYAALAGLPRSALVEAAVAVKTARRRAMWTLLIRLEPPKSRGCLEQRRAIEGERQYFTLPRTR